MPSDRLPAPEARAAASRLVADLAVRAPETLDLDGVDLGPALEQQLFFALRDGVPARRGRGRRWLDGLLDLGRAAAVVFAGLLAQRRAAGSPGSILVLVRLPARYSLLEPVEAELRRAGGPETIVVRVGRAAAASTTRTRTPRLQDVAGSAAGRRALRHQLLVRARLGRLDRAWPDAIAPAGTGAGLRDVVSRELPRIALGAAALRSIVGRLSPSVVVGYDEVGTWSRILPAVARAEATPSVNLPHAEAAAADAIRGASYDRFGVFGPRARAILEAAGVPPDRILETGAPQSDGLLARGAVAPATAAGPRRLLFAAQYVQGTLTIDGLRACHRAALAAAAAVGPADLIVLPHPVEPAGQIEAIAAAAPAPPGVTVVLAQSGSLAEELPLAWAMITGWSNSVFEAAIVGVPSILVDPDGVAPVDFPADGLGLGAADEAGAAAAARSLLDEGFRAATVAAARAVLHEHLGPLDGRAAERTAALVLATRNSSTSRP